MSNRTERKYNTKKVNVDDEIKEKKTKAKVYVAAQGESNQNES